MMVDVVYVLKQMVFDVVWFLKVFIILFYYVFCYFVDILCNFLDDELKVVVRIGGVIQIVVFDIYVWLIDKDCVVVCGVLVVCYGVKSLLDFYVLIVEDCK